jgi:hypothetical protein
MNKARHDYISPQIYTINHHYISPPIYTIDHHYINPQIYVISHDEINPPTDKTRHDENGLCAYNLSCLKQVDTYIKLVMVQSTPTATPSHDLKVLSHEFFKFILRL